MDLPAESATEHDHDHMHGGYVRDLVKQVWGYADPENAEVLSVHQLASLIDCLDKKLYGYGKIAVQAPSVFGQNRMTGYRQDFEDQMKGQLDKFELIINAYQRRSDSAALTSATSIAAAVQPRATRGSARGASSSSSQTTVAIPAPAVPFASLFNNASTLIGTVSPDLTLSGLAGLALANAAASTKQGIGLEPTVALDERANYLYHLNQLRRVNAGDDSSDLPGYGLYLIRMPVSLLPSRESIKGKGASVTVKAKHNLTPDVLHNTFGNVVVLDTAYSLMDVIIRGQFFLIVDPTCKSVTTTTGRKAGPAPPFGAEAAVQSGALTAGSKQGALGNAPSTEVVQIFGADNLDILVQAMQADQVTWYRHDPSVVSWLLSELSSAYGYMRDQAHRNNPLFQPAVFEQVAERVLQRRYDSLKTYRDQWITNLRIGRGVYKGAGMDCPEPIDVLSFALIVQSVYLDRQIKEDIQVMAQRKSCGCGNPWDLTFYDLYPTEPLDVERYSRAQAAFNTYVECKWPIHIFALDPVVDQQNELDLFSQRTQLQLALAVAVASGQVNFQNAESYARRTELDLATVALNRTAVGFGAGETTFGWQFYPRVQTPPLQSNLRRIAGILISNGPGPDYDLKNRKIEPGLRECYALIVMPNFVPSVKFTSVTNWFDLKTKHADQVLDTTDMIQLGKKLQVAKNGLQRVCDSGKYRPEEVELLSDRIAQLEDLLPLKSHSITLPFEGSLLGSEIFSSNAAGLAPRLLAWYGEPPQEGSVSSIFILGNGFSVHELHVIAGGLTVPDASVEVISRNVLRVDIPANARAVQTKLKIDGVNRRLLDVHVASPNGISNHLLVEAQPAPAAASAAPPTYGLSPDTRTLTVNYALLSAKDRKNGVPIYLGFKPGNAEIDLNWTDTIGIAPKTVDVTFNFPNPRVAAEGPLKSTLSGVSGANGQYAIDNSAGLLDQFSRDLLTQADQHNLLTPDNPLTQLTSTSIDVVPVKSSNLDTNKVSITDPLVVNLTPVSVVARLSPVSITVDPANFNLADATTTLTISWPPSVAAPADVKISLRDKTNGRAVGSLQFSSASDKNEVVYKGGTGTISTQTLQDKLTAAQKSFESQAGVAAGAFSEGDALVADSIFLSPQYDRLGMDQVLVTSNFEIDFAKAKQARPRSAAGAANAPAGTRAPATVPPAPAPGTSSPAGPMGSRSPVKEGPIRNASAAAFSVPPALPRRFGASQKSYDTTLERTASTARLAAPTGATLRPSRSSATLPSLSVPSQPAPASGASGTPKDKGERPGRFRLFSRLSQQEDH